MQALSHPFITGNASAPLPFIPAPDFNLQQVRNHQLNSIRDFESAAEMPFNYKKLELTRQISTRSMNMPQLVSQSNQVNGSQSFRPSIEMLPDDWFYGFCHNLQAYYEEAQIHF